MVKQHPSPFPVSASIEVAVFESKVVGPAAGGPVVFRASLGTRREDRPKTVLPLSAKGLAAGVYSARL